MGCIVALFIHTLLFSQVEEDTLGTPKNNPFTWHGFADVYFTHHFQSNSDEVYTPFLVSYSYNRKPALNFGYVQAEYNTTDFRMNLGLHTGTYSRRNYAAEKTWAKNIYQANVGIKVSPKKNVWLDAGVFPSHIGIESAVSSDDLTLTRSILAENSPYYESGAKLSYTSDNQKWFLSFLVLNGWQNISRFHGLAIGTQLTYTPNSHWTLNWSSYESICSLKTNFRMFHNLYAIYVPHKRWQWIGGFDIGRDRLNLQTRMYKVWDSPIVIVQYKPHTKWACAFRAEKYIDLKRAIISTIAPSIPPAPFHVNSLSVNVDFKPVKSVYCRAEYRYFYGRSINLANIPGAMLVTSVAWSINR